MERTKNISLFLLGILIFAIYTSLLKVSHFISEQFLSIDSINSAIIIYILVGIIVLILSIYCALYFLKKERLKILDIIILIVLLVMVLLIQHFIQKSDSLMINNFNLDRELRFKILSVRSYINIGLKIVFFLFLFFKTLKNK